MTSAELDRLAELEAKATPGPWGMFDGYGPLPDGTMRFHYMGALDHSARVLYIDEPGSADIACKHEDAELLARLRNAAPALLAAAREVQELREWQRDAVQWLEDMRGVCVEYGDFDGKRDIDELLARVKP